MSPILAWFVSITNFVKNGNLGNSVAVMFYFTPTNFLCDIGFVSEHLLAFGQGSINVYTDSSVRSLGFIGACSGTTAYFPKVDISISVKVLGLLFSTLVELQVIVLALECIPVSNAVILFIDSQILLDMCKFDVSMSGPDFHHKCEKAYLSHYFKKESVSHVEKV
ncbi:hypothetical protein G9A89_009447 [Geosiphon pyriformis]|nr:hypothetical protein G9A89_009447 [Geosiphon pyriformis]